MLHRSQPMQCSNEKEAGVKDPLRQGILFSLFYLEQGEKDQLEETVYSVKRKTSYKQLLLIQSCQSKLPLFDG